jgi:hypothetical protein
MQQECGMLCSEASSDEAGIYKTAIINDRLEKRITFMTCTFFAGIDIKDSCHLITVSNVNKGYSLLSLNRITQIHGRCRNGILSDTIVYNGNAKSFKHIKDYKEKLIHKAQKVIDLLCTANKLKDNDNDIADLFDRIEKVIMERVADESFFPEIPITLTRKNIDEIREISYFNIDVLCEQMETCSALYANKKGLRETLSKAGHDVTFKEILFKKEEKDTEDEPDKTIMEKIQSCKNKVIEMQKNHTLNDKALDYLIRYSKKIEAAFYERVKAHYKYVDIEYLTGELSAIALENKKAYRSLKNSLSFRVLDDKHPFKLQVIKAFEKNKKYTSFEIDEILSPIIKYHFFKTIKQSRLVNLFTGIYNCTRTQGKYLIKGVNRLPTPIQRIPANEEILHNYFEI